jgi:co-chaperonin GroES (HSP10)
MKKVNFRPFNGYLLLEIPSIKDKTETGIIKSEEMIKEEKKKNDNFVTIAAIDEKIARKDRDVEVGDKVIVEVSRVRIIEIDGVEYGLIYKDHIMGGRDN